MKIEINLKMTDEEAQPNVSELGGVLIEKIRHTTGLSHELSQVALKAVLIFLQENIKDMPSTVNQLLESLYIPNAIRNNPSVIDGSQDAQELRKIFRKLTACKDDEQQRSWALHEDEAEIIDNIDHLIQILKHADQSIAIHVMEEGHYNNVHALVLYYQMEVRWSIRELLLEAFALISTIDVKAVSVLVNSILPMELAREIIDLGQQSQNSSEERLKLLAGLLGLIWSTGEPMPITHFEQIGLNFLNFVFDLIESPPDDDEQIVDVFTNLILAYNLQFTKLGTDNLVLLCLAEKENAKIFTQKVVCLLNWKEDPVAVLPHEPKPSNSVVKLVTDLFSFPPTAEIFYTNDTKVLIDIVTRCVTDLSSSDSRRNDYIRLMKMVIKNSNYADHQHRKADLQKSFTSILLEEDPCSQADQELVSNIIDEFPSLFLV